MIRMSGLDAAMRLRRRGMHTPVVFFTTTRDYAVESYNVEAAGYLIKPVQYEKLAAVLDKVFSKLDCPRLPLHIHNEILFFESRNHATYVTLESGDTFRCAES